MLTDEELAAVAARLYARRAEGVITRFARAEIGDWAPLVRECHGNVTEWCFNNPQHKPVRGWLYFDLLFRFSPHSVVEDEQGNLVDITPSQAFQPYPFIRAEENEADYVRIVDALTERGVDCLVHFP